MSKNQNIQFINWFFVYAKYNISLLSYRPTGIVRDAAIVGVECERLAGDKLRDVSMELGRDTQPH